MSYSAFYFQYRTSMIHWWEYNESNEKIHHRRRAPLFFYMKDKKGEFTSIYGDKLKKKYYNTIGEYNDARKMYKDAGRKLFESDVNVVNKFILENWSDKDILVPEFDIHFLDIEVHSESGFPRPEDADHPVTVITVWSTKRKKFYIFALKEFNSDFLKDPETGEMKHWIKTFETEEELLKMFIKFVRKMHPDILSGWNSNFYDIPYIINRSNKILGERETSKISPVNMIKKRMVKIRNKNGNITEKEKFEIAGINCIDYLELYKNYTQNERESYTLDFIAKTEKCGEKLKYDGTLKELYHNDWQKYVEYNVQDVQLLINLDNRLQFMDMMIGICYNCRIPFEQFAITTKVLDGAFMSRLMKDKIALPDVSGSEKMYQYIGAYVYDPDVGVHEWVLSFDATSLYPSIMMEHNISPETKYGKVNENEAKIIMDILEGKDVDSSNRNFEVESGETCDELAKFIKENNFSIASNGTIYRHDKKGIVPKFVEEWFNKRKYHKKKMIEAEKNCNEEEKKLQYGLQLNYKILINSVYGYLGTEWSRLYDPDNATAVTTVGQECLKSTINAIDSYFREWQTTKIGKKLKAVSVDKTVCYGDTDSVDKNTKLTLENGNEIEIEKLFNNCINEDVACYKKHYDDSREFVFPKDLKLPYYDHTNNSIKYGNVQYIEKHCVKKKKFRIKTKTGKYVDVTKDHSCMVLLEDGTLVEKTPLELKKGDKVITISI